MRLCSIMVWFCAIVTAPSYFASFALAQEPVTIVLPEQDSIRVREPALLPAASLPEGALQRPYTVRDELSNLQERNLSLDEAIRIALSNTNVVRILGGVTASSSGSTVYDAAISQTQIEQAAAIFDPILSANYLYSNNESASPIRDPLDPTNALFLGTRARTNGAGFTLSKLNYGGSTTELNYSNSTSQFSPGNFPLNPQSNSFVEVSFAQPFLRGGGTRVNLVPILVAQIGTERSFFNFKNNVQAQVRSTIEGYWSLVLARTSVWVLEQQVKTLEENYERAVARKKREFATAAEVAQTQTALANFKASLVNARATMILRETALRNLLGMPPGAGEIFVPTTPLQIEPLEFDWVSLLQIGEQNRPDIVQLKLILEADQQLAYQANNAALPQFNGVASYRWNGAEGVTLANNLVQTGPGEYTNWTAGVTFSMPLGLRQARAALRRQELICQQDQLNIDQSIHQMVHNLTINLRNLDQFHAQYAAFKEARKAAHLNYQQQIAEYRTERVIFLNVLQAINDWGNAVISETQSLTLYNTELANLEFQTGTILETHGIRFVEERYGTIGPLRLLGSNRCYPRSLHPIREGDRYQQGTEPSEKTIDFEDIGNVRRDRSSKPESKNDEMRKEAEKEQPNDQPPSLAPAADSASE